MLSVYQLSQHVEDLKAGRVSFDDFGDWFRRETRDVHCWGDENLIEAIFAAEDVFSQYHFEGLRHNAVGREMENAIRPFVPHAAEMTVYVFSPAVGNPPRFSMATAAAIIGLSVVPAGAISFPVGAGRSISASAAASHPWARPATFAAPLRECVVA